MGRLAPPGTSSAVVTARRLACLLSTIGLVAIATNAGAATTVFFDSSQVAVPVASGVTSDTITSNGYLFTYTRDKLFTGGVGLPDPIGRLVRVPWPQGVEAQAVTTPPPGVTDYKARIVLQRMDGAVFDLKAFTAKLLANTAGTGASIEIMPKLNGEDGFNDPLYFDATGIAGNTFSYNESPSYLGSTALLKGFDTYSITLFVDFALMALTLEGPPIAVPPPPVPTGALSRKQHAALTFDLPLNPSAANPTTEPRAGSLGDTHKVVFVFDKPVTAGTVAVTEGTATAGVPLFNGTEMVVPLTGVADGQYVTVTVGNVMSPDGGTNGSGSIRIAFLLGDVTGSRVVTLSDLAAVNAQIGQPVSAANYLKDVDGSGTLTASDNVVVNAQLTNALPAP